MPSSSRLVRHLRVLPPGYPADLERHVRLADGLDVYVRPVIPDDAETLAEAVYTADSETLYYRFFTAAPRLDERALHYLTTVDYHHRLALAAFLADGEGVAVVRYEGSAGADSAEIAVTVKRGYRRRGLATLLLGMLEEAAAARGIRRFTAIYLPENEAVAVLLQRLGYSTPAIADGLAEVGKDLACASAA